jgi:iron complex transport system substrate-binding protein
VRDMEKGTKKIIAIALVLVLLVTSIGGFILIRNNSNANDYTRAASSVRLQVYGNANGDDYIDENDITYLNGEIKGDLAKSNYSDANMDGTIDQQDIVQVQKIIDHSETLLYYKNVDGENASVHFPVRSIIVTYCIYIEMVRVLNATDRIVGVDDTTYTYPTYLPELQSLPSVGNRFTPDVETVLRLDPDIYFTGTEAYYDGNLQTKLTANGTSIDVVRLHCWEYGMLPQGLLTLGYILGQEDEAHTFLKWYDGIQDYINGKLSSITSENKTTALGINGNSVVGIGSGALEMMELAGCNNLAGSLSSTSIYPQVEVEWVVEQNPDVIITWANAGFIKGTSTSSLQSVYNEVKTQYSGVGAVKEGHLYSMAWDITCGPSGIISIAYYAKWFYPSLFQDFHPEELHQEYLDRFCGDLDINVTSGAFVYEG